MMLFDIAGFIAAFILLLLLAALYAVPGVLIARFGLGHYKPVKGKKWGRPFEDEVAAALRTIPRHRHN